MEAEASTGAPSTSQQAQSVLGKRQAGSDTEHRIERAAAGSGSEARSPEGKTEGICCEHKKQLEEARRLLDLAMRELEATRAAAVAQMQLYDARAHSLEEQLRAARAERDAATLRAKAMEESARAARAAAEPPTPNTTLQGLFDSRSRTPLQSPNSTAQIAHQLADVRQQLEQIRQQRGILHPGTSFGHPAIPSHSGDASGRGSPLPAPVHQFESPIPNPFSLPPESISTSTQHLPNPLNPPAAPFQPTVPIPRAPLRSAPQFHLPAQPRPESSTGRPHPPEPPGLTLPRQGELLRTIERAAPLLNILMLGSLGPLPQWKNPPFAARPPPAPAILRHVPLPSFSSGGQPVSEIPRGTNDQTSPRLRPSVAHLSGAFSSPGGGSQLLTPSWHNSHTSTEHPGHPGQSVAGQPHPRMFLPPRSGGEAGDPLGGSTGQRSRHVQTGTEPLPTTHPMRKPT